MRQVCELFAWIERGLLATTVRPWDIEKTRFHPELNDVETKRRQRRRSATAVKWTRKTERENRKYIFLYIYIIHISTVFVCDVNNGWQWWRMEGKAFSEKKGNNILSGLVLTECIDGLFRTGWKRIHTRTRVYKMKTCFPCSAWITIYLLLVYQQYITLPQHI